MELREIEHLINQCKKKDPQAFRRLVEAYQAMVYSLSFRLLCNEEEAKDIVQETFLKVWLHLDKYKTDRKFSTWLYTIASNLCLDKLKSVRYHVQNSPLPEVTERLVSSDNVEQQLIDADLGNIIASLTEQLSPKQRVVFTLFYLEGIETDEIAIITAMTAEQIKNNLFLARKTMKEKLKKLEI